MHWKIKHQLLGGHVHIDFFVTPHKEGTYANCGHLCMTKDDWVNFQNQILRPGHIRNVIIEEIFNE